MKNWAKVNFDILNDERIKALIQKEGMKGFGTYMILLLHCECYNGMNIITLETIGSRYGSRNFVKKIIFDFNLFDISSDGLARARTHESVRTGVRDSAEASALQLTGAGHSNGLKELELELPLDEEEVKFRSLMVENYPNVMAMRKPLKKYEYDRGVARFGEETVTTVIQAMENTPKLTTKYISANLTMVDWCKRRSN